MIQRPNSSSTNITNASQILPGSPQDFFIKDFQMKLQSPALTVQYLPASGFVALGCEDGIIRVLSVNKQAIQYNLVKDDKSPVTCLASTSPTSTLKNTFMATRSGGTLQYWHGTSNQLLFQKKYNTFLQSCQISIGSQWYVISGENGDMLLGHLDKGNPSSLETGQLGSHANRVYCIKWHPQDPNIFFSGGWDKTVFMWDVRTKTSIKNIYGYYIGGQAIDVKGNDLLLGNNQNQFQLRIYDLKADKVRKLHWQHYDIASAKGITGVNSCCFGKSPSQILVQSSRNQIRYIKDDKCLSMFKHIDADAKGYSMSHSTEQKTLIGSWNNGDIKVMSY